MKTKLLLFITICLMSFGMNAQENPTVVSIIGRSVGGWTDADDHNMTSTDGVHWTYTGLTCTDASADTDGGIKFRANNAWTINWGAADFPIGTGVQNGANIACLAGTYDVEFNSTTGEYNFIGGTPPPTVKLIGTSVTEVGGLTMTPLSATSFRLNNVTLVDGTGQFEVDGAAFGETTFPEGDITGASDNIPVVAGTYSSITLNLESTHYTFTAAPVYPSIAIVGSGAGGWPSDPQVDANVLATADGETYTGTVTLTAVDAGIPSSGEIKFRSNNNWSDPNWGGGSFPTGPTTPADNIFVTASGTYDVVFTRSTGAYSFSFPVISLIGAAFGSWDNDAADLTTTDGANYSIASITAVANDGGKFRTNHIWTTPNYGSTTFPVGIALATETANIPVVAGTYSVVFNRVTGAFNFDVPFATTTFNSANFKVYPNPTTNVWNFTSAKQAIESIQIVDVLGKTVMTIAPKDFAAVVDASSLNSGLYFAKISTANATETAKLIKN